MKQNFVQFEHDIKRMPLLWCAFENAFPWSSIGVIIVVAVKHLVITVSSTVLYKYK